MSSSPSRRSVLQGFLAVTALRSFPALSQAASSSSKWLLLGTGHGQGIYRATWDSASGRVGTPELAIATPQPSYLTLHPRLPLVYCCNEDDAPEAAVSAFRVDRQTANLRHLCSQKTQGSTPCFVSVDPGGHVLFAANYGGGSLSSFPLNAAGEPGPAASVFQCAGNPLCGTTGPVPDRQSTPHLHCAVLSPDGRHLLACDLGDDSILVFPLHPAPGTPVRVRTAAGAGPRHLAFHSNHRWLYCVNELDCTVVQYRWLPGSATPVEPVPGAVVSIRPAQPAEGTVNTGAEIVLSRDGRFAYTSTRGANVLTVLSLDPASGHLTQVQQLACGGKTPRFFALDPSERWLLCGNQDSDTLSVFARDAQSGRLTQHASVPAANPQCIVWL